MKKSLLLICLCVLSLSASAQNTALKVQSDGNIAIQTDCQAFSPISINSAGRSDYYISCYTGGVNGLYFSVSEGANNMYCGVFNVDNEGQRNIGVRGYAKNASVNIGVSGSSGDGTKAIGVSGSIGSDNNNVCGAGIYGSVYNDGFFRQCLFPKDGICSQQPVWTQCYNLSEGAPRIARSHGDHL